MSRPTTTAIRDATPQYRNVPGNNTGQMPGERGYQSPGATTQQASARLPGDRGQSPDAGRNNSNVRHPGENSPLKPGSPARNPHGDVTKVAVLTSATSGVVINKRASFDELNKMLRISWGTDPSLQSNGVKNDVVPETFYQTILEKCGLGSGSKKRDAMIEHRMNLTRRLEAASKLSQEVGAITQQLQEQIREVDNAHRGSNFLACCCAPDDSSQYNMITHLASEEDVPLQSLELEIADLRRQLALSTQEVARLTGNQYSHMGARVDVKEQRRRAVARFAGMFAQNEANEKKKCFFGWRQSLREVKKVDGLLKKTARALLDGQAKSLMKLFFNEVRAAVHLKKSTKPSSNAKELLLIKFAGRFLSDSRRGTVEAVFNTWHKYAGKMQERGRGVDTALRLAPAKYYLDNYDKQTQGKNGCCGGSNGGDPKPKPKPK